MVLKLHSDSSYLNAVGARSQQGGHFFLGNKSDPEILNGAILHLAAIMKMVLSSAAEAEFGALFHKTKEATPLRTTLVEPGHPQPPTPILVENSTAVGLANVTVTQRRYAFLLGTRSHRPEPIPCVLGNGSPQSRRLLHQTSHTLPPPQNAQILRLHHC